LADFNNFWRATVGRNLAQRSLIWLLNLNVVATLLCEMQWSQFGHWHNEFLPGSVCGGSEIINWI